MSKASVIAAVAVTLLLVSFVVPAAGGPNAVSAVSALKIAKKALKKANAADRRSKEALSEAQAPGPAGAPGPQGPAGVQGGSGSPAFGSVTYLDGLGGVTGTTGYAIDVVGCPPGKAPTGGSFSPADSELGGNDPGLGDYGDGAVDLDDPADGYVDGWVAWAFNSAGSANVIASVICAPATSAALRALAGAAPDSRAEHALDLVRSR